MSAIDLQTGLPTDFVRRAGRVPPDAWVITLPDAVVLIEQRDRARALACRLEEELALIRRAATARRHG